MMLFSGAHPSALQRVRAWSRRRLFSGGGAAAGLVLLAAGLGRGAAAGGSGRFEPVDLSGCANRDHTASPYYAGEASNYSWLAPGRYWFSAGKSQRAMKVPFVILDPAKNGGCSILATRGKNNDFPESFVIPVYRRGIRTLYILGLAAGWGGSRPRGTVIARLSCRFSGAETWDAPLRAGFEIDDWMHHTATGVRPVLTAPGGGGHLDLLALRVPGKFQERMLTTLTLRSLDAAVSIPIFAITLEERGAPASAGERRRAIQEDLRTMLSRVKAGLARLETRSRENAVRKLAARLRRLESDIAGPASAAAAAKAARVFRELGEIGAEVQRLLQQRRFRPLRVSPLGWPGPAEYMAVLNRFPLYAERGWHAGFRGNPDLGWFGQGGHGENSLRPLGNFIFTYSVLAVDPLYDPTVSGVPRRRILAHALAALRYMTRTHVTGDLPCAAGGRWGNQWQSAWWTADMAAGATLLRAHGLLDKSLRNAVRRVVVHEADRQLARTPPSRVSGDTKAEENAWDAEVLAWASGMYPSHPHARAWEAKARRFCMNTLSVRSDRTDSRRVDGRPVREQVSTVNLHSDFTIENHGAYHFGYMACPLHSLTWVWYAYAATGRRPPQAVFHHFRDVWRVIRFTGLPRAGRFAYLGGKDWARYVYGLYFILPPLVLLGNEFGDRDARFFEIRRFRTIEWEQRRNGDGSFYGRRFTHGVLRGWPSEYETDTACLLALCRRLHRGRPLIAATPDAEIAGRLRGVLNSPACEWTAARARQAFISFSWRELHGRHPFGLFIPARGSDLAEWAPGNMLGSFAAPAAALHRCRTLHHERLYPQAFTSTGRIARGVRKDGPAAILQEVSFTALPRDGIAVLIDRCRAGRDLLLERASALDLRTPNDIFNANTRRLISPTGTRLLRAGAGPAQPLHLRGTWLNLDGRLGIVCLGNDRITVHQPRGRNAPFASLRIDRVSWAETNRPRRLKAGTRFRDLVFLFIAGDGPGTAALAATAKRLRVTPAAAAAVAVTPPGGRTRVILANLSHAPQALRAALPRRNAPGGRRVPERFLECRLGPWETAVFSAPTGDQTPAGFGPEDPAVP